MIHLEKVTWENYNEYKNLSVKEEQNKYVASSMISLAEAYIHCSNQSCKVEIKAIYNDNDLIGYAEILYKSEGNENYYDFHRFMIDKKYQGLGIGKVAFKTVMDYIKTMPLGIASKVIIEYMPENAVAGKIYHTYGFVDTNEFNHYGEIKAVLMINPSASSGIY
jgi:Acetyltransferases